MCKNILSMDQKGQPLLGSRLMNSVQVIIRNIRIYLARKKRQAGYRLIRISFSRPGNLIPLKIIGDFTSLPWKEEVPMNYSLSKQEFYKELWVKPGHMFNLKMRSHTFLHPNFPISTDISGREANVICPEEAPCQELKALLGLSIRPSIKIKYGFKGSSKILPHHNEDAVFLSSNTLGVADGVGSWRQVGINSRLFAEQLLYGCRDILEDLDSNSSTASNTPPYSPKKIPMPLKLVAKESLQNVFDPGSSTLLLAYLSKKKLRVLNLGDSGLVVIRMTDEEPLVHLKTSPQQHCFNTPYQLSKDPSNQLKLHFEEGEEYEVQVQRGDLVMAGTDGLWDNLFTEEILDIVKKHWKSTKSIVEELAKKAKEKTFSLQKSPFQEACTAEYGDSAWRGGKPDDIGIVAAYVSILN